MPHNPEMGRRENPETDQEILDVEKMENCLESAAEELNERKIAVDRTGKVDMDYFEKNGIYSKESIQKDKDLVEQREKEWKLKNIEAEGEEFEKLVTVIFHKYLPENFSIVRSSRYDDIENSVDNFIIEKKTGSVICSLDEIESNDPGKVENKMDKVDKINKRGGTRVKYGIRYEPGKEEPKYGEIRNVPLFFLAVNDRRFLQEIRNLRGSIKEKSPEEQKFFVYLTGLLKGQIERMKNNKYITDSVVKERIRTFEKLLEGWKR